MSEGYTPVAQRPSSVGSDTAKTASDLPNKDDKHPPYGPDSYKLGGLSSPVSALSQHSDKQVVEQNRALDAPIVAIDDREEHEKIMYNNPSEGPERVAYKPYRDGAGVDDISSDAEKGSTPPASEPKTICGIRRKRLIIIGCVFAVIFIAVGVGVGVSQGTKSKADDTTQTSNQGGNVNDARHPPLSVLANTGISSAASADGRGMYTYHQAPNGRLIENYYAESDVTAAGIKQQGPVAQTSTSIDTVNMAPASPLAATAYSFNGSDWRHIFYITNAGIVQEMKTSGTNWTAPTNVANTGIAPGSRCLAACYGPVERGIGVRVLAGFSIDAIGERYSNLSVPGYEGWNTGVKLTKSTNTAGCACSVEMNGGGAAPLLHMYSRNDSAAGNILHAVRDFDVTNNTPPTLRTVVEAALRSDPSMNMDAESSMTVTNQPDGGTTTTDWLFYQGRDGRMKQFLANAGGSGGGGSLTASNVFNSWDARPLAGTKMAVTWLNGSVEGPLVLYQTDANQIRSSVMNYNAVAVANATLRQ